MKIVIEDLLTRYKKSLTPVMESCYNNPLDNLTFTATLSDAELSAYYGKFLDRETRQSVYGLYITTTNNTYFFAKGDFSRAVIL